MIFNFVKDWITSVKIRHSGELVGWENEVGLQVERFSERGWRQTGMTSSQRRAFPGAFHWNWGILLS